MANLVKYQAKDGQAVELSFDSIKKFLVSGKSELVTNQEMIYFMGICKARGLNPFAKDCYLIKYTDRDPAAIVVSIDFFRSRARAQPDCRGWEAGVIVKKKDGTLRYSKGLVLDDETLVGGWFKARPDGWDCDFELEVNLGGYIKKTKEGKPTQFWREDNRATMIRKVAESQGLREVWPSEFGKMYLAEELDRATPMDASETVARNANQNVIDVDPEPDPEMEVPPEKDEAEEILDEIAEEEPQAAAGPGF